MKLARLSVNGFKGLEAFALQPMGKHVVARGKNGAGKSSLLDSIYWALTGDSDDPVRNGAKEAKVSADFGVFSVTRKRDEEGKTSIVARRADGQPIEGGAAAFLKQLVGPGIGLAPMGLYTMKDSDQVDSLLKTMKVDVAASYKREKLNFDLRTETSRELKRVKDERAALIAKGADAEVPAAIDPNDLLAALTAAREVVASERQRGYAIERAKERIARALKALEAAQVEFSLAESELAEKEAVPSTPKADENAKAAEAELAGATQRNARAGQHRAYLDATSRLTALEAKEAELTKGVEVERNSRGAAIAAAAKAFGVDGLAIAGEDGAQFVQYRGVRLSELSTGEKVLLAARIAAATKPELRVVLVDEASALDEDGLAVLFDLGKDLDVQLVLAQVTNAKAMEVSIVEKDAKIVQKVVEQKETAT